MGALMLRTLRTMGWVLLPIATCFGAVACGFALTEQPVIGAMCLMWAIVLVAICEVKRV